MILQLYLPCVKKFKEVLEELDFIAVTQAATVKFSNELDTIETCIEWAKKMQLRQVLCALNI